MPCSQGSRCITRNQPLCLQSPHRWCFRKRRWVAGLSQRQGISDSNLWTSWRDLASHYQDEKDVQAAKLASATGCNAWQPSGCDFFSPKVAPFNLVHAVVINAYVDISWGFATQVRLLSHWCSWDGTWEESAHLFTFCILCVSFRIKIQLCKITYEVIMELVHG